MSIFSETKPPMPGAPIEVKDPAKDEEHMASFAWIGEKELQ